MAASLLLSVVFVALSVSFVNGVGLLRAQLVSQPEPVRMQLTTEGFVPSEITVEPGSSVDFESLLSVEASIRSEEQNAEGNPELSSPPLSTGQVWSYTPPLHLDGGALTLSTDAMPGAIGRILVAKTTADTPPPVVPSPLVDASAPVTTVTEEATVAAPSALPSPNVPPGSSIPTPTAPTPTSNPFALPSPPATPSVLTLTAPPIEVVQSPSGIPEGFRINRFTVGSPLVPPASPDFDGSAMLAGGSSFPGQSGVPLHAAAPLALQSLQAPPTPWAAHQPQTGPLLSGIVLVGLLLSLSRRRRGE